MVIIPKQGNLEKLVYSVGLEKEGAKKNRLTLKEITDLRFALSGMGIPDDLCRWSYLSLVKEGIPCFLWLLRLTSTLFTMNKESLAKQLFFTWLRAGYDQKQFISLLQSADFVSDMSWQKVRLADSPLLV